MTPIQGIERILILRTDGIGDILNSTPAIAALRDAYRGAHISVLVRPPGTQVLLLNPHIDEILVYDAHDLHKRLTGRLRFLRQLRAGRYDLAVVLHNSSRSNLAAYLSGARYRVGRKSERKRFSFTLTHGVSSRDPKGTKHEIDRNMDAVRLVGANNRVNELILRLSAEERAWAQDFLRGHGVVDRAASSPHVCEGSRRQALLVGIHPGGSSFDKLWPAENFAHAANRLVQEFEAKIILFSGPGEDALVRSIQGSVDGLTVRSTVSADRLRLRQFAALVERCSLFICNDSGPMHIAAALRVPTVAIFGPTDHVRWRPYNEKAVIARKDMDCWPCSAHKCKKDFECIKSLSVSDVWNVIIKQANITES